MTVALADGPLGLEAKHIWTPGNGAAALTMHDLHDTDTITPSAAGSTFSPSTYLRPKLPRVKFDSMPGFRSLPDADDNRQPRTARPGESTQPSLVRGRSFTTEGRLQARSLQELRQLQMACLTAFSERDLQGTWSAVPLAPYGDPSNYWQSSGRVLSFEPQEEFLTPPSHPLGPWQLPFVLGIRQGDARWTWTDEESGSDASDVIAHNSGSAPAEPVIRIVNPGDTATFIQGTTGKLLRFTGIFSSPAYIEVDFAARTATLGGVTDAMPYFDSYNSDWWDRGAAGLLPGDNDISQGGGDSLTVTWKHTSW